MAGLPVLEEQSGGADPEGMEGAGAWVWALANVRS